MAAAHMEARVLPAGKTAVARAQWFVGRRAELEALRAWLTCPDARPLRFLVGPGGIGKTALSRAFYREARASGHPALFLDARSIAPSPPAVMAAVACAGGPSLARLTGASQPPLVVIDAFEAWRDLEYWLREHLLPQFPADLRLLVAARRGPAPDWCADPGWRTLLETTYLHGLPTTEAREYAAVRGVPRGRIDRVQALAAGHPLALTLAAELGRVGEPPEPGARNGGALLGELATTFARTACDDGQRRALDIGALVSEVDENMLAGVLDSGPQAAQAYQWLRDLPFVAEGPAGLSLNERLREVLLESPAEHRPLRYEAVAGKVVRALLERVRETGEKDPDAAAYRVDDVLHALRAIPGVGRMSEAVRGRSPYLDRAHDGDLPALEEMIQRRIGVEAAQWLPFWYARQPEGVRVVRDASRIARAFFLELDLAAMTPGDRDADPLTRSVWRFARSTFDLRPGECLAFVRYWGGWDAAASDSPEAARALTALIARNLTEPGRVIAMTVGDGGARVAWARLLGLVRMPDSETSFGEHIWRIHCGDWRSTPAAAHYAALARHWRARNRRLADGGGTTPDAEFEQALARVLKHWHRDRELAAGPLAQRLQVPAVVRAKEGDTAAAGRVRRLVEGAAAALPDACQRRVLHRAYFAPAASQRNAAAALGMGYSTFRRRLAESRRALAAALWQRAG